MKILVIDDAADARLYVSLLLRRWGYEVLEAEDGHAGLDLLLAQDVRLVICDWMMPGMSGPELCRAVRTTDLGHYAYIILLTGRSDSADLVEGLNAGADDFVTKPFEAQVLRARLRVGERILALEQRLGEQNRDLLESRNRLAQAYDQIQADLATAARIQRQLLPTSDQATSPFRAHWLFLPAAQVSGDSFNFFELTPGLVGFYHLDISGHGVPAALLSVSLSRSLVPGGGPGTAVADFFDPATFLADLNRQLTSRDGEVENYATIAYGTLEKHTGRIRLALAAHPYPLVLRQSGRIDTLQQGGLPVGMFPVVDYQAQEVQLAPGDRLVLYSDGVTECRNRQGEAFGEAQLRASLSFAAQTGLSLTAVLDERLRDWRGPRDFEDDISLLVLERPLTLSGDRLHLRLHSNPDEVADLQPRLLDLCAQAGLDAMAAFKLTTAIVEALNNCIEHAYGGEPGQPIDLEWTRGTEAVAVAIHDEGQPLPARALDPAAPASADAESGRGWQIIHEWTHAVSYQRTNNRNVLTLTYFLS